MPRARDPNRDKAFEIWNEHKGEIANRAIAEELDIDEKKVAVWKQRDKWNVVQQTDNNVVQHKETKRKTKPDDKEISLDNFLEGSELNDKQRLFCLYYVKSFNATQSAINAGYSPVSAHVEGHRMLKNPKIFSEIKQLKADMANQVYLDAMDVLNKYIKIAFSDMADFLTFGKKMVPVIGAFGPVKDDNGVTVMQEVNYVDFKDSNIVDGTIISEVKQGKDGVSIKLEDRMKALDKLSLYFDLFPDNFKRKIDEEKLKLAQQKLTRDDDQQQEKDVAEALRGLVNGINSKAD